MNDFYDSTTAANADDGLFGLSCREEEARVIIVPVPFEATASFNLGTVNAPAALLQASEQLDLFHPMLPHGWQQGICLQQALSSIKKCNNTVSKQVAKVRAKRYQNAYNLYDQINQSMLQCFTNIEQHINTLLRTDNKKVGLLGGDHSTAMPNIAAHLTKYSKLGVLHVDAHDDLRNAYEGFEFSHASVMYNILERFDLSRLVSVGIRDYSMEEHEYALTQTKQKRLARFTQDDLANQLFQGQTWHRCCAAIISELPQEVYVSCDIDGLDPAYCPNTGTPVPGGLSYQQVVYLFRQVIESGRRIVGFDLVEVGAHPYDANVGARLLYELSILSMVK